MVYRQIIECFGCKMGSFEEWNDESFLDEYTENGEFPIDDKTDPKTNDDYFPNLD